MSIIPEFLIKRLYKKGSLKETADGISFELKNILGPGVISGINFVKINDQHFGAEAIKFLTSGIMASGTEVSPDNPVKFRLNQEGKLILEGAKGLKEGINKIIVEIMNPEAGNVQITLTDTVTA